MEIKKIDELEQLEKSLNFLAIKNRFWVRPNNPREELRLREIKKNEWDKEIKNK